jgi:hypothetical protein
MAALQLLSGRAGRVRCLKGVALAFAIPGLFSAFFVGLAVSIFPSYVF